LDWEARNLLKRSQGIREGDGKNNKFIQVYRDLILIASKHTIPIEHSLDVKFEDTSYGFSIYHNGRMIYDSGNRIECQAAYEFCCKQHTKNVFDTEARKITSKGMAYAKALLKG
jgi:hypothetical protein